MNILKYLNLDNTFDIIKNYKKNNYLIYIIIFILINLLYFRFDFGNNTKLKTLIAFYGSLSIFLSVTSFAMTAKQATLTRLSSDVVYVNQVFSNLDNDIYNFFQKYDKLMYYYNELYNVPTTYKEEDRNFNLEKIISKRICTHFDILINYIDSLKVMDGASSEIKNAEDKLKKILQLFLKSKIFVENWKEYSSKIALDWTNDYIEMNFD